MTNRRLLKMAGFHAPHDTQLSYGLYSGAVRNGARRHEGYPNVRTDRGKRVAGSREAGRRAWGVRRRADKRDRRHGGCPNVAGLRFVQGVKRPHERIFRTAESPIRKSPSQANVRFREPSHFTRIIGYRGFTDRWGVRVRVAATYRPRGLRDGAAIASMNRALGRLMRPRHRSPRRSRCGTERAEPGAS